MSAERRSWQSMPSIPAMIVTPAMNRIPEQTYRQGRTINAALAIALIRKGTLIARGSLFGKDCPIPQLRSPPAKQTRPEHDYQRRCN